MMKKQAKKTQCNFCGSDRYEERRIEYLYTHKGKYLLVPNTPVEICLDCGNSLEERTHKSHTHSVCDDCMYERRRRYKDKAQYGDHAELAAKARLVTIISIIGSHKTGGRKCQRIHPLWQKKVKKLQSELSKI